MLRWPRSGSPPFYAAVMAQLADLKMPLHIHTTPNEIADAVPFEQDTAPRRYEPSRRRGWQAAADGPRVQGVSRPLHRQVQSRALLRGSFDLAVTRFSGREAPPHPGGVPNSRLGGARSLLARGQQRRLLAGRPSRVSGVLLVRVSRPRGFAAAKPPRRGVVLDCAGRVPPALRRRPHPTSPDETLLEFLQSTYEAAANPGEVAARSRWAGQLGPS
jgi:hypothetical protein